VAQKSGVRFASNSFGLVLGDRCQRWPGYATLDLRWSRAFELAASGRDERPEISIGVDAFNVTNHVNFNTPVGNQISPFFGRSISSRPPRRIQLSASVTF
jgi:hypothetical protein